MVDAYRSSSARLAYGRGNSGSIAIARSRFDRLFASASTSSYSW